MKLNYYLKIIATTFLSYLLTVVIFVYLEYNQFIKIHITLNQQDEFQWNTFVIIGVILTVLVSLIGYIQNNEKENHRLVAENIAKARIEWLQNARNHFSAYLSLVNQSRQLNITIVQNNSTNSSLQKKLDEVNKLAEQHYYQLIFMINPTESIVTELDSLLDYTSPSTKLEDLTNLDTLTSVSKKIQAYFHNEWVRAKKEIITGEVVTSKNYTTDNSEPIDTLHIEQNLLDFYNIFSQQLTTALTFISIISSIILSNMTLDKTNTKTILSLPEFSVPFTILIGLIYGLSLAFKSTSTRWNISDNRKQKPVHEIPRLVVLFVLITIWAFSLYQFYCMHNIYSILVISSIIILGLGLFILIGLTVFEHTIYYYLNCRFRKSIQN